MPRYKSKTVGIEPYIIECICLRLHEKEALSYLSDKGYDISTAEYYSLKKEVQESAHTRLNQIASKEFLSQHIERIDTLKTVHNELWDNYHKEKNSINRAKILMQIADIQFYLSSYYDSTRYVLEQSAKTKERQQQLEESHQQIDSLIKKKRKKLNV